MTKLNFDDFVEQVGLCLDDDFNGDKGYKMKMNIPQPDEDNGSFDVNRLDELKRYCEVYPCYHIVTQIDVENGIAYANEICIVNRLNYYLARGSKDKDLFCEILN